MIPEIQILRHDFEGKKWNTNTQVEFIKKLAGGNDFDGKGSEKDVAAFSGEEDRIHRAPKALRICWKCKTAY